MKTTQKSREPTFLDIHEAKIEASGALAIAETIGNNTTLKTLHINGNNIGSRGTEVFLDSFKYNSTLTSLNLSQNNLLDGEVEIQIAELLNPDSPLVELDFSNNPFGDSTATKIANALRANTKLAKLNMSNNALSYYGAVAFANALQTNHTLAHLDFHGNQLGIPGIMELEPMLIANNTLKFLDLTACADFFGTHPIQIKNARPIDPRIRIGLRVKFGPNRYAVFGGLSQLLAVQEGKSAVNAKAAHCYIKWLPQAVLNEIYRHIYPYLLMEDINMIPKKFAEIKSSVNAQTADNSSCRVANNSSGFFQPGKRTLAAMEEGATPKSEEHPRKKLG